MYLLTGNLLAKKEIEIVIVLLAHHSYRSVASTDLSLCQYVNHLNHTSCGSHFAMFRPLNVVELRYLKASNQWPLTLGRKLSVMSVSGYFPAYTTHF